MTVGQILELGGITYRVVYVCSGPMQKQKGGEIPDVTFVGIVPV